MNFFFAESGECKTTVLCTEKGPKAAASAMSDKKLINLGAKKVSLVGHFVCSA